MFVFRSPVRAAARGGSAGVGSPGVPSPHCPPEAAAGTAGEPAEGERGGSAEREGEASTGKRERRAEARGELVERNPGAWGFVLSGHFERETRNLPACLLHSFSLPAASIHA